ncbi:hypothetical protein QO199_24525 [Serratia bockelmannii]|uniref:Uncharacterized protein n=1 Tax=Serratia bockelmannii TaxID=2703793 RepID=A0ABT8LWY6_9GAMM|nr:hypothetical protein [Serratia bockelmannii]MDN6881810.1 hypothetical protein [Serratia bockelmannii]HBH6890678.1 hypothetical protein [Serratia marcescens]
MKRLQQFYDLELPVDADYKIEAIHQRNKEDFESLEKWLYLGADSKNAAYAKIGITTGNMASRSYSSVNPGYYLFCAFKCAASTTKAQLEDIERSVLHYLDGVFTKKDGTTKREYHFESRRLSECYYDIDFNELFWHLHHHLFEKHTNHFIVGYLDGYAGDFLDCEFNPTFSLEKKISYIKMILQ